MDELMDLHLKIENITKRKFSEVISISVTIEHANIPERYHDNIVVFDVNLDKNAKFRANMLYDISNHIFMMIKMLGFNIERSRVVFNSLIGMSSFINY
jgi:phosphoribosylaminoimidazole-succinocarboxamide synthase